MKKIIYIFLLLFVTTGCNQNKKHTETYSLVSEEIEKTNFTDELEVVQATKKDSFVIEKTEEELKKEYIKSFSEDYINKSVLNKMGLYDITSLSNITDILSETQINNIVVLTLNCSAINSFEAISLFSSLYKAQLYNINVSDISPLALCKELRWLYITNGCSDCFSSLHSIDYLDLLSIRNSMIDASLFTYPKNVSHFSFSWCSGDVIETLKKLPDTVEELTISDDVFTSFDDLEFLLSKVNLQKITVIFNSNENNCGIIFANYDRWNGKQFECWPDEY